MGARKMITGHHFITLGNHIINCKMQVWKSRPHGANELFILVFPQEIAAIRIMADKLRIKKLIHQRKIPLMPDLIPHLPGN